MSQLIKKAVKIMAVLLDGDGMALFAVLSLIR